jgi:hypothetical protein
MGKMTIDTMRKATAGGGSNSPSVGTAMTTQSRRSCASSKTAPMRRGSAPRLSPKVLLYHLPAIGVSDDPGQRQVQMMLILYTILQFHMPDDTDRPGAIYDYAGREDIKAQLRIRDKQVTANINRRPMTPVAFRIASALRKWLTHGMAHPADRARPAMGRRVWPLRAWRRHGSPSRPCSRPGQAAPRPAILTLGIEVTLRNVG